MKKIFESDLRGKGESAERVYVYEFENEEEYWEFENMSLNEQCALCGVTEETGVLPGALYHRYYFDNSTTYAVMYETVAYNV